MTQVHESAADHFIMKEAHWFTVEYAYAAKVLSDVMDNYKKYLELSRKQGHFSKTNFNLEKMGKLFCEYVDKGVQSVPQQVNLSLPKLKKLDETPKLKLPKLKKVKA